MMTQNIIHNCHSNNIIAIIINLCNILLVAPNYTIMPL